jgi:TonB family protein
MRPWIICIPIVLTSLFAQQAATPADARGWITQGLEAYKQDQYDRAIDAFEKAINLEPGNVNAHLYLGTALVAVYIPGAQFPENASRAARARSEFLRALELDSNNRMAMSSLANMSLQEGSSIQDQEARFRKLDDSRDWFVKVVRADPGNRDAWYSLGTIGWMKSYPDLMAARARIGMKPEDPGPLSDAATRLDIKLKYGPLIEDGIMSLIKALEIDPSYVNAMAYLNLLFRERADLRDSPTEYRRDMAEADRWFQRAVAAKQHGPAPPSIAAPPPPTPPPSPPAATPPPIPSRIRAGSAVAARLIYKVDPVYPPLALQARIQGVVHFTAIIGTDGRVLNLQLIGGHPLLVQAAEDAVKQWLYEPTRLNGTAVEVVTQIDVEFTLPVAKKSPVA